MDKDARIFNKDLYLEWKMDNIQFICKRNLIMN